MLSRRAATPYVADFALATAPIAFSAASRELPTIKNDKG